MKKLFRDLPYKKTLEVGDLIRSYNTYQYINIVLELTPVPTENAVAVRSVRYAKIHNGDVTYLNGTRSRSFLMHSCWNNWTIVEECEVIPVKDASRRKEIVERLKDVDTAWRPREESSEGEV